MIFSFDKIKCKIAYFLIWMIAIMLLFSCSDKRVIEEYNRLESNKIEQTKNEKAYKQFKPWDNGFESNYDWDEKQKYISVVRFNGGGKNENK